MILFTHHVVEVSTSFGSVLERSLTYLAQSRNYPVLYGGLPPLKVSLMAPRGLLNTSGGGTQELQDATDGILSVEQLYSRMLQVGHSLVGCERLAPSQ